MTNHHDQDQTPGHPLTEKQQTYSKLPAQLVLAYIRDDGEAMQEFINSSSEHLTYGELLESLVENMAGLILHSHNWDRDAAEETLQKTILKINAGTL